MSHADLGHVYKKHKSRVDFWPPEESRGMTQVKITCSHGMPTTLALSLLCPLMSFCPEILDALILAL